MKLKFVLISFLIGIFSSISGEIFFFFDYRKISSVTVTWIAFIFVFLYVVPILFFFRNKNWAISLLIPIFYFPIMLLTMFLHGKLLPLKEEDFGAVFLGILIHGSNLILLALAIGIGNAINLMMIIRRKFNDE